MIMKVNKLKRTRNGREAIDVPTFYNNGATQYAAAYIKWRREAAWLAL